jgi:signal peptidase I
VSREESKALSSDNQVFRMPVGKRQKCNQRPIDQKLTQSSGLPRRSSSEQRRVLSPQPSTLNANNFEKLFTELLQDGHSVKFRAPGDSMYPTICDGDEVTVTPIDAISVHKGDIILYRNKSGVTAHRVIRIAKKDANSHQNSELKPQSSDLQRRSSSERRRALSPQSSYLLRGDAAIVFDDPVRADQIMGKVTLVERQGRRIDPYSLKATICFNARRLATRLKRFILFQS